MTLPRGELPTDIDAILKGLLEDTAANTGLALAAIATVRQLSRIEHAVDGLAEQLQRYQEWSVFSRCLEAAATATRCYWPFHERPPLPAELAAEVVDVAERFFAAVRAR